MAQLGCRNQQIISKHSNLLSGFLDLPGSLSVLPTLTQVDPGLAHLLRLPGSQLGDGDGGVADWLLLSLQAGADPSLP